MLEGLITSLSPIALMFLLIGSLIGIVVGALPGLTATMSLALLVPFTFGLEPELGLMMIAGLLGSSMFADAVPAVLINTPGTASAMATTFDGYPLTRQGQGQRALVGASAGNLFGSLIGGVALLLLSQPLVELALSFGGSEYFWLGVFALTTIGALSAKSVLLGLMGGAIGLLVSAIGAGATGGVARYTFGIPNMLGGIHVVAALIGIFALRQALVMVEDRQQDTSVATYRKERGVVVETLRSIAFTQRLNIGRSGVIGTIIGILPGAGPPIAGLVSYNEAARWNRGEPAYGEGNLGGVIASEVANNSASTASLIPLLTLGVPGSAAAAVVMGALFAQGLTPGAGLYEQHPEVVYTFVFGTIWAGITACALAGMLSGVLIRMVTIPYHYLIATVLLLCLVGSFAIRNNPVDLIGMFALGLGSYLLGKIGIAPAPIALGVILGPIIEDAYIKAIALADATSVVEVFFTRPISIVFICLTVLAMLWPWLSAHLMKRSAARIRAAAAGDD